jgi:hypothetical protein
LILSDFLIFLSDQSLVNSRLYFQPGHNGPYNDSETLVRNYGHWLITFSKCFKLTGDKIYLNKITELAEYLISKKSRPFGFSFNHRLKEGKDKCNGLIGQAWTFESLICASSVIADKKYSEIAEDVFFQHNFNNEFGLWNILETDGTILSIDNTFNHQLWFAACASLLNTPRQETIRNRIYLFLDFLLENISVLDNGLIYHPIERPLNHNGLVHSIKSKLKKVANTSIRFYWNKEKKSNHYNKEYNDKMLIKSVGYHQFNMYAFALLKESIPDHQFWKSSEFQMSVDYLISGEFKEGLSDNIYGYPYNPPGFEVPYVSSVLTDMNESELVNLSCWWLNEQIKRCYNPKTQMMDRNTKDSLTLTARIYELTRLPNSILDKTEVDIPSVEKFTTIN